MRDVRSLVLEMQVTEKGTALSGKENKYFFKVAPQATKRDVKRAVEAIYGVEVLSVNTANYEGKRKRERTAKYGRKRDWKRAVVSLKEGQGIETV